jgi:hypothetical protein
MKITHKRGRPRDPNKRRMNVMIRLTVEEFAIIKAGSASAGLSLSEYVRRIAIPPPPKME